MKPTEMLSAAFWYGFFASICFNGMIQDFYGKEMYIRKVQEDWLNTSPYMWMLLLILAVFAHFWQKGKVE